MGCPNCFKVSARQVSSSGALSLKFTETKICEGVRIAAIPNNCCGKEKKEQTVHLLCSEESTRLITVNLSRFCSALYRKRHNGHSANNMDCSIVVHIILRRRSTNEAFRYFAASANTTRGPYSNRFGRDRRRRGRQDKINAPGFIVLIVLEFLAIFIVMQRTKRALVAPSTSSAFQTDRLYSALRVFLNRRARNKQSYLD